MERPYQETFDLSGGWKAVRLKEQDAALDTLTLYRSGRRAYRMEIPPKMPAEDVIILATQISTVYDTAAEAGWQDCRQAVLSAVRDL